ncbi:hypothetical protein [Legionella yabuuchiae]|uniref:hypothetical protein n=1 Tax=Legionella yabuuchiae TaxID=376727 RepID=UPI0010548E52|nr:hypothetical protein [Legionella yabuuchiae]
MMTKRILATLLCLALASAFAFTKKTQDDKGVMATFKTDDGKEIRCWVDKDDLEVIKGVKGRDVLLEAGAYK